jgi:hypothetical protein
MEESSTCKAPPRRDISESNTALRKHRDLSPLDKIVVHSNECCDSLPALFVNPVVLFLLLN